MFVLMIYGPFRFSMASFAYERIRRKAEARIEPQKIIGASPSLHRMGFEAESLSFTSTFFPHHLPGNQGLAQLAALRAAVGQSMPLIGNRLDVGDVFGRWVLKSVSDDQSEIFVDGLGQKVEVQMELLSDSPNRTRAAQAVVSRLLSVGAGA